VVGLREEDRDVWDEDFVEDGTRLRSPTTAGECVRIKRGERREERGERREGVRGRALERERETDRARQRET
jgi:hypothetical protein